MIDERLLEKFFRVQFGIDQIEEQIWEIEDLEEDTIESWIKRRKNIDFASIIEDLIMAPVNEGKYTKRYSKKHLLWLSNQIFSFKDDKNSHVFFYPKYFSKYKDFRRSDSFHQFVSFFGISTPKGLVYNLFVENSNKDNEIYVTSHFLDRLIERVPTIKNRISAMQWLGKEIISKNFLFMPWRNGAFRCLFSNGLGMGHAMEYNDGSKVVLLNTYISSDMYTSIQKDAINMIILDALEKVNGKVNDEK